jgi:hypothetical protein
VEVNEPVVDIVSEVVATESDSGVAGNAGRRNTGAGGTLHAGSAGRSGALVAEEPAVVDLKRRSESVPEKS